MSDTNTTFFGSLVLCFLPIVLPTRTNHTTPAHRFFVSAVDNVSKRGGGLFFPLSVVCIRLGQTQSETPKEKKYQRLLAFTDQHKMTHLPPALLNKRRRHLGTVPAATSDHHHLHILFLLPFVLLLTTILASSPVLAAPVAGPVRELFDSAIIRDFRLDLEPLAGWRPPADWSPPADWPGLPTDWADLTSTDQDAWIAQDAVLAPLAKAAAWDTIRCDTTNSIVLPALFHEEGMVDGTAPSTSPLRVGIRRKSSRALPSEIDPRKVGFKVGFNDFVKGQLFRGVSKLSLENAGDVSPAHEGMAWHLHQLASVDGFYGQGYDPALAAWTKVSVNGEYLGVYTNVEQRNKQFLRNRALWWTLDPITWMYKQDDIGKPEFDEGPASTTVGEDGVTVITTPIDSPTCDALCFLPFRTTSGDWAATCSAPATDSLLAQVLTSQIDMRVMLTQAAIDAFVANDDAMLTKGKNFFFVDRTGELRRHYPWDLDSVFRAPLSNIYAIGSSSTTSKRGVTATTYTQSQFQTMILNHPVWRAQYNSIMTGLLDGPLSASSIDALFARVRPALELAMATDPYSSQGDIATSIADHLDALRAWIAARQQTVRAQITANVPAPRKADAVAPTVQVPVILPSATSVLPGALIAVTSTVSDTASEIMSAEVRVGTIDAWQLMAAAMDSPGQFGSALTVVATASLTAPTTDGIYTVCVRATDRSANTGTSCTSSSALKVETPARPTTLTYTGLTTVKVNTAFILSARLVTSGVDSVAVAGKTVTFVVNKVTFTGVTDGDGVAAATAKAITKTGSYSVAVSFAGAVGFSASSVAPAVTLNVVR
jgi:hypothetical protein